MLTNTVYSLFNLLGVPLTSLRRDVGKSFRKLLTTINYEHRCDGSIDDYLILSYKHQSFREML